MTNHRTHIELFAGCGGLCLGLESEGIELLFANELSPMAGETFAYNILGEDLLRLSNQASPATPVSTLWLNSKFRSDSISRRLSENPQNPPEPEQRHDERPLCAKDLERKLLIGSILDLNAHLESNASLAEELKSLDIDLVSGGPPCQSFSMAGLRQRDNHRNTLPLEFARFVSLVKPKMVVLENVSGILHAFSEIKNGKETKYYAWHEVAKSFALIGYIPICLHVNAKYAGVAQNRPRFVMIGIRSDLFPKLSGNLYFEEILENSRIFFERAHSSPTISKEVSGLKYWDTDKHEQYFLNSPISPFIAYGKKDPSGAAHNKNVHTVEDAIGNLCAEGGKSKKGPYLRLLDKSFPPLGIKQSKQEIECLHNNNHRANNLRVRKRFRLYQVLSELQESHPDLVRDVTSYLKSTTGELRESTLKVLLKSYFLEAGDYNERGVLVKYKSADELLRALEKLKSKKQTQRALKRNEPAPAALSIPDDACHYSAELEDIRTLSVREMARIQSFPDWFVFRSKETTGGQMRKFQVPQYTQVGNAVPPLLGKAIGKVVNALFDQIE